MTNPSLEQSLRELEAQLEVAAKSASSTLAILKKAQSSARVGLLRELNKHLADGRVAASRCSEETAKADTVWKFDPESYFEGGAYLEELKAEADRVGLKLFEKDGRVYCFPMLLTISDKEPSVTIDRKAERRIRPSELVQILLARQKRPLRSNEQKLIETLLEAYSYLGPNISPKWTPKTTGHGPVVPLMTVYKLLTILPGSEKEYPPEEFARDIYLLDRQPNIRTRDGRRFALPAATGSKDLKQRLTVIDEQGREKIYVGIRFDKE